MLEDVPPEFFWVKLGPLRAGVQCGRRTQGKELGGHDHDVCVCVCKLSRYTNQYIVYSEVPQSLIITMSYLEALGYCLATPNLSHASTLSVLLT